jgi:hypothetical protein
VKHTGPSAMDFSGFWKDILVVGAEEVCVGREVGLSANQDLNCEAR